MSWLDLFVYFMSLSHITVPFQKAEEVMIKELTLISTGQHNHPLIVHVNPLFVLTFLSLIKSVTAVGLYVFLPFETIILNVVPPINIQFWRSVQSFILKYFLCCRKKI